MMVICIMAKMAFTLYAGALVMHGLLKLTPAIIFGIMSRRVTLAGAIISVLVGVVLAMIFVSDQLMGVEAGRRIFPLLHHTLGVPISGGMPEDLQYQ